jgi:hypothetical protein
MSGRRAALKDATDLAARAEATLAETETARAEAETREAENPRHSRRCRRPRVDACLRSRVPHPPAGAGAWTRPKAIVEDVSGLRGYEAALAPRSPTT